MSSDVIGLCGGPGGGAEEEEISGSIINLIKSLLALSRLIKSVSLPFDLTACLAIRLSSLMVFSSNAIIRCLFSLDIII